MKRWLIASILFLLPSCIAFPLVRIFGGEGYSFGRKSRIGFSLILTSGIYLGEGAVIQSRNLILTKSIHLGTRSRIQRMNLLKGRFRVQLDAEAVINKYNRILSASSNLRESELILGINAIIGVSHFIDMTASVRLGANSILAGIGSQLWTHGFYHSRSGAARWRVDGSISIGQNVYVGSRVLICSDVCICDAVTVGAGAVVAKSLTEPGLYVGQALRYKEFDPDQAICHYAKVADRIYEKRQSHKNGGAQ